MAEGKLMIEVYEYGEESSEVPPFEYIPCNLEGSLKKNKQCRLRDMIRKGFDDLPKSKTDTEKRQQILDRLDEADIGRINVRYQPGNADQDPYVELTNVVQVTMSDADARRLKGKKSKEEIILYGRYRMTDGNDTTRLRDSQRLTLIYSSGAAERPDDDQFRDADEEAEERKEIFLNITYMQG